jgi:hypothetical protein
MSYTRSFSKHTNQLMSANDYIHKKKAQTLFQGLTTSQQPQTQFNVSRYDRLLTISKGSYYVSPQGKTIELSDSTTSSTLSSIEIDTNDCNTTTIKVTQSVTQPITQTWNIYEGSYIINKTNNNVAICPNNPINPNITISNELISSSSGQYALSNLNKIDILKKFYYPKKVCV